MTTTHASSGARDAFIEQGRQHLETAGEILRRIEQTAAPFTRQTVLDPLNDLLLEVTNASTAASLLSEVHPEVEVREAAEALERDTQQFTTALHQNRRLYEALCAIEPASLTDPLTRRALELMRQDMRREGAELDDVARDRIRVLNEELVELEQDFARNIRDDVRSIALEGPEELEGLPPDYIAAHPPGPDGTIRITTDYPDAIPFMAYARSERARKALMRESQNRAVPANLGVLEQILAKRHEVATLLGYANWADYVTETKMTGTADAARAFIEQARAAAQESCAADLAELLAAKRREGGEPVNGKIGEWELSYLLERVKAERFNFDTRTVRPYFEYRAVKQAILALNSELFGLTFTPALDLNAWHPSVETYDVANEQGETIGRFSLDMHPREGKFKHAACFTLRMGVAGKQLPHPVLVCNFPDPAAHAGPALMEHREVVTFFHEFGHLVHNLMRGAVPWVRLVPVSEWDFVEAPSQFLEEYIFDFEVLRRFARHVETGETIPAELVERLRAARDFGRGISVQRQLYFSALSLYLHDRDPHGLDTTRVVFDLAAASAPFELIPDTHFQASFGHLTGYSAVYYTYMWSLVIAKDLHRAFAETGLLDVKQARRYRDLVLAPGGSKPAAELVQDFLGRPYNFDAFRDWLAPRPSAAA